LCRVVGITFFERIFNDDQIFDSQTSILASKFLTADATKIMIFFLGKNIFFVFRKNLSL